MHVNDIACTKCGSPAGVECTFTTYNGETRTSEMPHFTRQKAAGRTTSTQPASPGILARETDHPDTIETTCRYCHNPTRQLPDTGPLTQHSTRNTRNIQLWECTNCNKPWYRRN
jgi:hypothetical protein